GASCVGVPAPGIAVEVRDETGRPVGAGVVGEVHVASDGLMRGYWNNPGATAEVLRDGWLNMRDLGCLDADGYLWVVDRRTDLILRGGQNVYPAEVEEVLNRSPYVADVAVVPAPSPIWGQTPVAFVAPAAGIERAARAAALRDRGGAERASNRRRSRFELIEQIPRNPAGKILRKVLRDRLDAGKPEEDQR